MRAETARRQASPPYTSQATPAPWPALFLSSSPCRRVGVGPFAIDMYL
ncbi:hypothetical protein QJS66_16210 [Kocuria rhizophila]|nr:hypothetical protein QJS66_16210 [Kocuria rhizophila]